MKPRSFLTLGLLAVLMLVSCAPADSPAPAEPEAPPQPAEPVIEKPAAPPPAEVEPTVVPTEVPPTEAPAEVPQSAPTSRGPDLHASTPSDVSLASGDLQLVEFFRYT